MIGKGKEMKHSKTLRNTYNLVTLALAAKNATAYRKDDSYDVLALSLEGRVSKGVCDPVAAEAALNDHSATKPEVFNTTPKGERAAQALAELVGVGLLDPLFAENVLDHSFDKSAVCDAIGYIAYH